MARPLAVCTAGRSFGPFTFATASIIGVVSERFTFPACPVRAKPTQPPAYSLAEKRCLFITIMAKEK